MRKCCCCISVHAGAIVLGVLGFVLAALELVLIIPYLLGVDDFNPIKDNTDNVFYIFDDYLKALNLTDERREEILETARTNMWVAFVVEASLAGVYLVISLLLILGVKYRKRALMLPYMIIQMIVIIIFVLVGVGVTILLYFVSYVMLGICAGVVIIISFLFFYFWFAVQKAYVEIGNRDYMYSPAPVKPIYNPPDSYHHSHPTAPQQFRMD